MSKSAIYVINTTNGTKITAGSAYPVNQVVRRFGRDLSANGTGVTCKTPGYYKVSGSFTVSAAAASTISAALYSNGAPIPGAVTTAALTADEPCALMVDAIIRVNCCANPAELAVVISGGDVTSVNAELSAFKL